MQAITVGYWFKNLLGFAFIIAAAWLLMFYKDSTTHHYYPLLKEYHNQIGFILFPLGSVIIAGLNNIVRVVMGLIIIAIGAFAMAYFIPMRSTWTGQLITNFIAPAAMLGGMLVMVMFENDINSKRRR